MKRICSVFSILLSLMFPVSLPLFADDTGIVIERSGKQANPTLVFTGVNGASPELNKRIQDDLITCGWFDVRKSGASDYIVGGNTSGSNLTLTLMNGAKAKIADLSVSASNTDQLAAAGVDAILKHEFNIPGICRSKIVFSATTGRPGKREIYMCDFDGRNVQQISRNNRLSVEPVWAPDGRSIIYGFVGETSNCLVQHNFSLNKDRALTNYRGGLNAGGELSPDGRYLVLVLGRGNQVDLYIRPTEGGNLIRLTNDKSAEASPTWTPDGKKICYVSDMNGRPQIYVIDPFRKTSPARLQNLRGSERVTPDFSSDGQLAYSAKVGGDYVVTVADCKDISSPKLIKIGYENTPEIPGEGPSWAPDNRHVAVSFKGVLFIVDTRLGTKRRLLSGNALVYQPDWSPILP